VAPLFPNPGPSSCIRQVLAKAYPSGANIDAELVEILPQPAPIRSGESSGIQSSFSMIILPELLADLSCRCACSGRSGTPWESPAERLVE